jgi:uncharacterized membrane protein YeaQ/YmgE (transglycosylase-associated protein family)
MEMILWIAIGALAGAVASFAFRGAGGGIGTLSSVAVGCVAALLGALAIDAVVGAGVRVRVTLSSGSSFASFGFGLAPALAAAIAAVAVLVGLERAKRRSAR